MAVSIRVRTHARRKTKMSTQWSLKRFSASKHLIFDIIPMFVQKLHRRCWKRIRHSDGCDPENEAQSRRFKKHALAKTWTSVTFRQV